MNRRMVFHMVGQMLKLEAALMLLPMLVAVGYGEPGALSFLAAIAVALVLGFSLTGFSKPQNRTIFAKEGFAMVALTWLLLSAVGALPFVFSGEIPRFVDAFFETVSGFTTTGSSILTDVEAMSHGMLFWRSFTHWIGGMGIIVFIVAIMPSMADRSIHILRAEVPGPSVGKLVPRIRETARILYLIYLAMTMVQILLLLLGGMSLFDSAVHTFGTAGTGGFGIKADSIGGYSHYSQWIIGIFMLLFGINFNLYYLLLVKKFKDVLKSDELWAYLGIVGVATALIMLNTWPSTGNLADSLRLSFFQVASIITTTGYATTNFDLWPHFSKAVLLVIMFIGGCAGSTAGGLKVSRIVILFKTVRRELQRMIHPRSVSTVRFEGKPVDNAMVNSIGTYLAVYMLLFAGIFLVVSLEPFGLESNFSAVVTCFNNVGPGFGIVGPAGSFAPYSDLSKWVLSLAMLLGRLEIYPVLIALSFGTWTKRS